MRRRRRRRDRVAAAARTAHLDGAEAGDVEGAAPRGRGRGRARARARARVRVRVRARARVRVRIRLRLGARARVRVSRVCAARVWLHRVRGAAIRVAVCSAEVQVGTDRRCRGRLRRW